MLPATDDFSGENGDDLPTYSAYWSAVIGMLAINSSAVYPFSGSAAARWNGDLFADNQFSEVALPALAVDVYIGVGCHFKADNSANLYYFVSDSAGTILGEIVSGIQTDLKVAAAAAIDDVLRLEVRVNDGVAYLRGLINNIELATATSSSHVSGSAGLVGSGNNPGSQADNWVGGDISTVTFVIDGLAAINTGNDLLITTYTNVVLDNLSAANTNNELLFTQRVEPVLEGLLVVPKLPSISFVKKILGRILNPSIMSMTPRRSLASETPTYSITSNIIH